MHCPICSATDTKVIDSRLLQEGSSVRRRRKCEACETRFTTYEKIQLQMPMVVKQDGRRENYNREKVLSGLNKACQKRPISTRQIDELIESVEKKILEVFPEEVPSDFLGEVIMKNLHKLDPVAFVRFASFYWNFDDIKEFISSLELNVTKFKTTSLSESRVQ